MVDLILYISKILFGKMMISNICSVISYIICLLMPICGYLNSFKDWQYMKKIFWRGLPLVVLLLSVKLTMLVHSVHYSDDLMTTTASQITSLTIVYLTVDSDADQSKHQSSASLAFAWEIHRDRWIPRTKGQLRGNVHVMTSSWDEFKQVPLGYITTTSPAY